MCFICLKQSAAGKVTTDLKWHECRFANLQVNGDKAKEAEDDSDEEYVNIFQTTVVEGKRRHFVPKGNKETDEW